MHYPMVLAAAIKFDHCNQQDDNGIYPTLFGIWDISLEKIGDD
jgi:hypothetical protein